MSKRKSAHPKSPRGHSERVVREDPVAAEADRRVPSAKSVVDASRQSMIAEAAYYLAQKRGFTPGREVDDWLTAEAEIAQSFLDQQPDAADLH